MGKSPKKTPGPKVGDEGPAVVVAASLPQELVNQLDEWRAEVGRSAAISEAVRRLVGESKPHKPVLLTMPPDWAEAFKEQAAAEGTTLSRWIAETCRKALSAGKRRLLSEARSPGRRPKK